MDDSRTSNPPSPAFDLLNQPFRILSIDPAATSQRVLDAFEMARRNYVATDEVLSSARDDLLDPSRRLDCELAFPLDGPAAEVPALFAALTAGSPTGESLAVANRLAPLARANFLAHIAARRPASSALLFALVESHAFIDATQIFDALKRFRAAAAIPAPALVSVNQGLEKLLGAHASAALAGFEDIDQAIEPVLTCSAHALRRGGAYRSVLAPLLARYRELIKARQASCVEQIEIAGRALQGRPAEIALLEPLARALGDWVVLCRPLMLVADGAEPGRPELELAPKQIRLLTADLASRGQYGCALQLASIGIDAFFLMPTVVHELRQDMELIARLAQQAKLEPLLDMIDRLQAAPAAVIVALTAGPFGDAAPEPAKALWEVFLGVLKATDETRPVEPWRFVRNFAMHLSGAHGSPAAAASVLLGLLGHGEAVGVNPDVLGALHQDLVAVTPGRRKAGSARPAASAGRRSAALAAALAGLALVAGVSAVALYEGAGRLPQGWLRALSGRPGEVAPSNPEIAYPEITPAVGTGQHLALPGVRYCHYQAARLEIIKLAARSPEDVRAYNLLVVDYNSRCSDFFYQDKDLAQVNAEVAARRTRFEADAKRIMAGWPRHAPDGSNSR
jgi:hypothetical protein